MTKAHRYTALRDEHHVPMPPSLEAPEWVAEMHAHYQELGFYRAADVVRGLGNPTTGVGHSCADEPLVNYSTDQLA